MPPAKETISGLTLSRLFDALTRTDVKLNIELLSFNRELELYEREGILLPVARVIKPKNYINRQNLLDKGFEPSEETVADWRELDKLFYGIDSSEYEDELKSWNSFDMAFKHKNKFLLKPKAEQYKPWKTYRTLIEPAQGESYLADTATHYYHAWQVHQIYFIQNYYPLLAKHNWVLQNIKDEAKKTASYLLPKDKNALLSFFGNAKLFDALSFYTELYQNEQYRTFESIPENDGIKRLNDEQFSRYNEELIKHAHLVANKFQLDVDKLYEFLRYTLDLHTKYESKEKYKLADELEEDIIFLSRLISGLTGKGFIDVEQELGRISPYWTKEKFRHFDKAIQPELRLVDGNG